MPLSSAASPTWAGAHAPETISDDPSDYVFFLSKDEKHYGCFSNAHRERNGHRGSADGSVDDGGHPFASPPEESPRFWCVNQELHYRKAVLFRDHTTARKTLDERIDALRIKQLGREVKGYNDAEWCRVRYASCRDAVYAKFAQDEELKKILLGTGSKIIVEAARDRAWGIGVVEFSSPNNGIVGAKNKETGGWDIAPGDWTGENLLGRCLMDARGMLLGGR